jgi:hypothetical protein
MTVRAQEGCRARRRGLRRSGAQRCGFFVVLADCFVVRADRVVVVRADCARWDAEASPPFCPARRASSLDHSCAVPLACAALPPRIAISRCLAFDIDANPLSVLATDSSFS